MPTVIIILLLVSLLSATTPSVKATTVLSLEPGVVSGLGPGDVFTLNLTVAGVSDLDGWQAKLVFDSTKLQVVDAGYPEPGTSQFCVNATAPGTKGCYNTAVSIVVDNSGGSVFMGATNIPILAQGPEGTGLLAFIAFKVLCSSCSDTVSFAPIDPETSTDPTKLVSVVGPDVINKQFLKVAGIFTNQFVNPPVASFTADPPRGTQVNVTVTFDGSGSRAVSGFIAWYAWNFGDGSALVNSTSSILLHRFEAINTFKVVLMVGDSSGLTNSTSISYSVAGPFPNFILLPDPQVVRLMAGAGAQSEVFVSRNSVGFNGTVSLQAFVDPALPNGPVAYLNPTTVAVSNASIVSILAPIDAPVGNYTVTIQGVSGHLTNSIHLLAFVVRGPSQLPFLASGVIWSKHLSLAHGFSEIWDVLVSNPDPSVGVWIGVHIVGVSRDRSSSFVADSTPFFLQPGRTVDVKTSYAFNTFAIGQRYEFKLILQWGSSPSFLPGTTPVSVSGSFTVGR